MSYERNSQTGLKSATSLPRDIIRLWPDGPPRTMDGVGPEVEFRGPVGTVGDAAMLRNVSDPTLTVTQTPFRLSFSRYCLYRLVL